MSEIEKVCYFDRHTEVMLGDYVRIRVWFRKLEGRIVYVPGKSKSNPAMDFNGLYSVGERQGGQVYTFDGMDQQGWMKWNI